MFGRKRNSDTANIIRTAKSQLNEIKRNYMEFKFFAGRKIEDSVRTLRTQLRMDARDSKKKVHTSAQQSPTIETIFWPAMINT